MHPPLDLQEELFCTKFELRLLAGVCLQNKLERWIEGFSPIPVEKEHMQRYRLAAAYTENKIVLDIACGTGRGTRLLAEEGKAASVTGYDIDADSIRYAKGRNAHPKVDFLLGDGLTFSGSAAYDFVVCYETIEHVSDAPLFLTNLARSMKEAGQLLISTPVSHLAVDLHPSNPYHVREWSLKAFSELVSAQFHVEEQFVQYHPRRTFLERASGKVLKIIRDRQHPVPEPLLQRWQESGLREDRAGVDWTGFQILRCTMLA